MSKYKITILTPLHISSGEAYDNHYNILVENGYVYFYDIFKLVEFFIGKRIEIPQSIDALKQVVSKYKSDIMASNLHFRKAKSHFSVLDKPVLEHISTASKPIISGSSIKGSIRTAYIDKLVAEHFFDNEIKTLADIENELSSGNDKQRKKDKNEILKTINSKLNTKSKKEFRHLKVSDTLEAFSTEIVQSINIKKERQHQSYREVKTKQLSSYVEVIKVGQSSTFTIDISDDYFGNIANVCNDFYKQKFYDDFTYYFSAEIALDIKNMAKNQFLLNIGRFSGAELKSIDEIRDLPRTGSENTWETSARTYALAQTAYDKTFFDKELTPFGWVLCEALDVDIKHVKQADTIVSVSEPMNISNVNEISNIKMGKLLSSIWQKNFKINFIKKQFILYKEEGISALHGFVNQTYQNLDKHEVLAPFLNDIYRFYTDGSMSQEQKVSLYVRLEETFGIKNNKE